MQGLFRVCRAGGPVPDQMLERVEKYEIVEEIGHGGMATVYRARDTHLDRPVALKVMHPHLQGAKEARARFAREARTVARLRHPGILEIYDYGGEDSSTAYIATELLTGPTLKELAEAHPDIPAELAACLVIPIARALSAAHSEGVVHRDVKPENIMLHDKRSVKLTDFGIAQLLDAQTMTATGQVLGSPGHMAPEQVEGREHGPRTDIFALGTVLYLLATGQLPFRGRNPHQVLKQIVEGRYADPLQVRPAIGTAMQKIIMRCLQVDPDKRYPNASELEADLERFVKVLGIESADATLAEMLPDPAGYIARFRAHSIERLAELGEQAQRAGNLPFALDCFNRVLALDESNARVLGALKQLGRRRKLQRAALGVGLVIAFGAALFGLRSSLVGSKPPAAAVGNAVPAAGAVDDTPPLETPDVPIDERPTDSADTHADGRAGNGASRPPKRPRPPQGNEPRLVVFQPFPANTSISVNGGPLRPFGPSFHEVELEPGTHRFKFVGGRDCCEDEEVEVRVPSGPGQTVVAPRLRFKPAGLYVISNTPSNVSVDDGKVSGRARSVIQVQHLNALSELHRLVVSADGFQDHVQEVRLQAGRVATVEVTLKPGA